MNKTYLAIISVLLVIALAVGGYAVYKTVNQPADFQVVPPPPPPPPAPLPVPEKKVETPKNTMPLTMSAPKDGDVVTKANILIVSGKTSPNAEVTVNEKDVKADKTGAFTTTIVLEEGENPILVFVTDESGNYAQWEATITYNPPQ